MPPLLESYAGSGPVDRVNRAVLPQGGEAEIVEQGVLYDRFRVYTPKPFVFRLFLFYFPGWHVYIDGQEVEIEVAGPEGFITFWVSEGKHDVLVRFEDTPPRTAGWVISAVGLVALVVALALMPAPAKPGRTSGGQRLGLRGCIWLGGAILLFVILKSGVIDPHDNWLRYTSPPGQAWAAQHELHVNFGDQVELLGYDLPYTQVRAGEALPLTLYWRALAPLGVNYQSFVHLAQPIDVAWAQEDHLNPGGRYGGFPTTRWPLDKYVWDVYRIQVPADVPPGRYMLNVGLYSLADGYRLQVLDDAQRVVGDGFVIVEIEVIP
jgi:hypothetical protein